MLESVGANLPDHREDVNNDRDGTRLRRQMSQKSIPENGHHYSATQKTAFHIARLWHSYGSIMFPRLKDQMASESPLCNSGHVRKMFCELGVVRSCTRKSLIVTKSHKGRFIDYNVYTVRKTLIDIVFTSLLQRGAKCRRLPEKIPPAKDIYHVYRQTRANFPGR